MQLLIVSLCVVTTVLIVLEATPCSPEKKRQMMIEACGHHRKKRGFSYSDIPSKKTGYVNSNTLHDGESRHHKQYKIIANDTTGGILIRHKRGGSSESFMYCCLTVGNCTEHFFC